MKRKEKITKKDSSKIENKSNQEPLNAEILQELFQKSADVKFQEYMFNKRKVMFITCDAMVDTQLFNNVVIEKVRLFISDLDGSTFEKPIIGHLHIPALEKIEDKNDIITSVYSGKVILYFEDNNEVYSSDISQKPNRSPEETKTEVPIRGPRDNFIEDISINIALIRKRLPTNSLCVETYHLGRRTKTTVALLYFDDIVNKDILNGIKGEMQKIDIDIVFSGELLMEFIDKSSKLFPRHDYTGRPDYSVQSLARGRVLILVDGVAYGVITPVNLFLLFKTAEDNEYQTIYGSFERLLRLAGVLIGVMLPAFWLALTSYHQDQLPLLLLATVVQASTGLPFPAVLEMFLMIAMFELFREAGLRLPESIGGTLSVVGGLIIGDASIRAGITSPAMIVIIAISIIATFTLVNQSLVTTVSILRFFSILLTAFLGLFGFFMAFYFTLLYLANIRTFGVPYLDVAGNLSWSSFKKTFIRPPQKDYKTRPSVLQPFDKTRQKEDKK